ncbi:MAG: acyl carrier protein [Spirochaetales bacterium]|nr:acyl carrier protein [Spirochaetales bacterium]
MSVFNDELKRLIISSIELEDITVEDIEDGAPLFGEGLGLDSIDALEIGVALKKKYNIKLSAEDKDNRKHFASINALAEYIMANTDTVGEGAAK